MAIEIRFVKGDSSTAWGFRLTGGAEYDEPISVVKVNSGSLAEIAGLQVGDIVVRVNDTPFAGLTHAQAHDIITGAGNEFILAVRRDEGGGLLFRKTDVTEETISNAEVTSILQTAAVSVEQQQEYSEETSVQTVNAIDSTRTGFIEVEITIKDQQDVYATEDETVSASKQAFQASNNITEDIEICEVAAQREVSAEIQSTTQQRQWSTFLQKPKGPKPKIAEPEGPKGEPYRVVIKKQKKKEEQQEHQLQQQEFVAEIDIASNSREVASCSEEVVTFEVEESEVQEYHTEHHEQRHKEDFELDVSITTQVQEETYVEVESEADVEAAIERACREPTSLSVEEQLAQVQKQLQQLSQLPSAIQATLDAVTKQLATIVTNGTAEQKEETESIADEDEITELVTTTDGGLTTVEEEEEVKSGMHVEAEMKEDAENCSEEIGSKEESGGEERGHSKVPEMERAETPDSYAGLTEEEKEAKKEEEARLAKVQKDLEAMKEQQQRRLEQRPTQPLTPLQRPIILPGGRRWVDPEDASKSIRRPKMTDEKIADTIETHSELLIGRTKGWATGTRFGHGQIATSQFTESNCWMVPSKVASAKKINFLKYQPPPKNLDYLQRSEVYRLVHDMEPPIKGIARRPSKILSEEDYYQKTHLEVSDDKKQ